MRTVKQCQYLGCKRPACKRHWCSGHYQRLRKEGTITPGYTKLMGVGDTLEEQLWSRVDKFAGPEGCWLWQGNQRSGYGRITFRGVVYGTHRLALQFSGVDVPADMMVCHRCDVRACCNPRHLFIGTARDNVHDMRNKGRLFSPQGENNGQSRLQAQDVVTVVSLLCVDTPYTAIAARFDVSESSIRGINKGTRWRHITAPIVGGQYPIRPLVGSVASHKI